MIPTSEPPSVSLLFTVLFGLPVVLWTYKCLMMTLFQRKIIYMGYIPPGTRQEKLSDVPGLSTLLWKYALEETQIMTSDRLKLSTLIMSKNTIRRPDCVLLYLQGNAGNPLHRIPVFTSLLSTTSRINPVICAPAPRSYWSSSNRTPTERGILADYRAALLYAAQRWPGLPLVLYGHSLGGAIAVCLLASLDAEGRQRKFSNGEQGMLDAFQGLVLENPFSSIPGMVHALYPQRWLPYRYLTPFVWDQWNALYAMRASSSELSSDGILDASHSSKETKVLRYLARRMLVLTSTRDEVVPPSMGRALFGARPMKGGSLGSDQARLVEIDGALHEDAWRQLQWRREMVRYLESVVRPEVVGRTDTNVRE